MVGAFLRGRERAILLMGILLLLISFKGHRGSRSFCVFFLVLLLWGSHSYGEAGLLRPDRELDRRYAPYVDWSAMVDLGKVSRLGEAERSWRTPSEIIASRSEGALPLDGLHLALDPGHLGGIYAEREGRSFRIDESDFIVQEGDLVLEVASLIREDLERLGARVTMLREADSPAIVSDLISELEKLIAREPIPDFFSIDSLLKYAENLETRYFKNVFVYGELVQRAKLVNEQIQPDALISLHINAAPWPKVVEAPRRKELVDRDHSHVLIFGCLTESEMKSQRHRDRMIYKMSNGSGAVEELLGANLGLELGEAFGLPPSRYSGENAVMLESGEGYLWARNLLLLREVNCPTVLLEPFLANSSNSYHKVQAAIRARKSGHDLNQDDVLILYRDAVVKAITTVYGSL